SLKAPDMCQFTQPGFNCNQKQHVLVADTDSNVRLIFQLDNSQGRPVKVLGVLCTDETSANVNKAAVTPLPGGEVPLASGQSHQFGNSTSQVPCMKADGTTNVVLTSGSSFKGTLAVVYRFEDEVSDAPSRLAVATLSGTVQSED
ncbi:hypothetical protein H0O00_04435, partial [Candidatus Micrarchaeota archaeon]|nr:hypothetical protein [Candidatus Micrarchaeota archaeon]